ncbi:unnamed protein product [Blepharisma stoltei]|uniref:Coiled-coil domain-containing protein 86 n=1 Tax=Blepharisma stoltei TaxID=1481888 RepID=A0AAU9ID79_9CILI|nr:unnamed protein product [Blepharisma stoltei]
MDQKKAKWVAEEGKEERQEKKLERKARKVEKLEGINEVKRAPKFKRTWNAKGSEGQKRQPGRQKKSRRKLRRKPRGKTGESPGEKEKCPKIEREEAKRRQDLFDALSLFNPQVGSLPLVERTNSGSC